MPVRFAPLEARHLFITTALKTAICAWRSVGVALHVFVLALVTRFRRHEDGDVRLVLAVADICESGSPLLESGSPLLGLRRMLASRRANAGVEESDRLGGALGETDKRKTLHVCPFPGFFFLSPLELYSLFFFFPSHALDFSHIFPQMCI